MGDGLIRKELPTTREKINETSVAQIKTPELSVDDISSIKLHVTGQSQALYAFNLYRAILKLEEDKQLNGIPIPNGIMRELLIRLKRRILKRGDMACQTASSVIRQSTVQPDYKSINTTKQPIGFPTQETTKIVEEQKYSTNMDDLHTSVLNNMKKDSSTVSKESVD